MENITDLLTKSIELYETVLEQSDSIQSALKTGEDSFQNFLAATDAIYKELEPIDKQLNQIMLADDFEITEGLKPYLSRRLALIRKAHSLTVDIAKTAKDKSVMIAREIEDNQKRKTAMKGYASNSDRTGKMINKHS